MSTLLRVFTNAELSPSTWSDRQSQDCYFFNPAITCFRNQHIMAYRVVMPDSRRRLALCRLSDTMQVIPDSIVPFSDSIQDGGDWHADARFCSFQDRLFLHYNDGSGKPNHIYLVEIDPDTLEAYGPARELVLEGARRLVEKNWMLFDNDDALWAVYSIGPHIVLKLDLGTTGPIICRPTYQQPWDVAPYATRFGELRGGAPPVRIENYYVSFCHSAFPVRSLRWRLLRLLRKHPQNNLRYVSSVYTFAAEPPFAPLGLRPEPLPLLLPVQPKRAHQLDSRVERVVYPCGAILGEKQWIVSFGAHNAYCCLAKFDIDSLTDGWLSTSNAALPVHCEEASNRSAVST